MKQKQKERILKPQTTKKKKKAIKKPASEQTQQVQRLQSQLQSLQSELKKVKNQAASERKKCRSLKHKLKLNEQVTENYRRQAEDTIENMKKRTAHLQNQVDASRQSLLDLGWDEKDTALETLRYRNQMIVFLLQKQIEEKSYLNNAHLREHHLNQEIHMLHQENKKLKDSNETFKRNHQKMRQTLSKERQRRKALQEELKQKTTQLTHKRDKSPKNMIADLMNRLSPQNFHQYRQLNKLFSLYQYMFQYKASTAASEKNENLYGFLVAEKEKLFFHDLNDKWVLPLLVPADYQRPDLLTDGMAVQVRYKVTEPEYVSIVYCYPIVSQQTKVVRSKRTAHKRSALNENIMANEAVKEWAAQKKITVVGNRQVEKFVQTLSLYVKKVEKIDAYEAGEKRTFALIKAADYAFVLTDSVPHSVTDFVKRYDPSGKKVHLFYQPDTEDGVVRLNYLYWTRKDGND